MANGTAAGVRLKGGLPDTILDPIIDEQLSLAIISVRELIGGDVYDAIKAGDTPYTATDLSNLVNAEEYFALSSLFISLTYDANSRGAVQSGGLGDSSYSFLSPEEAKKIAAVYRSRANTFLTAYLPTKTDRFTAGDISLWPV